MTTFLPLSLNYTLGWGTTSEVHRRVPPRPHLFHGVKATLVAGWEETRAGDEETLVQAGAMQSVRSVCPA